MSSATVGVHHSGAGPLSLMSCVRESSPQPENEREMEKNTTSKKKFWNPKRWFKRKQSNDDGPLQQEVSKDSIRSRSTSELSDVEDDVRRRSTSSMHATLSLSHDSVFQSPHSGSSEMELEAAQSASLLSISQPFDHKLKTELCERLRLRRGRGDNSEDDEGLPRSPCNSPTTADDHHNKTSNKDLPTKSHSTCSDGSLLSMDSSEMDEDSFGLNSRHSSKLSLHEKKNTDLGSDIELGPSNATTPLNHSAAHHRVAVRPKRTHGAPRRKTGPTISAALPATPEVNEDSSIRSLTPESIIRVTDLSSLSSKNTVLTESQLKCSSLPPGLVGPGSDSKLNRSKSNAGSKSQDHFSALTEHKEEKSEKSFFFHKLIRSSGKKKKSKEKHQEHLQYISSSQSTTTNIINSSTRIESKPIAAPRSSASTRQRVQPKNIPISPEEERREIIIPKPSPEKNMSPIKMELENRIKQRQSILSTSPTLISSPPQSPKVLRSTPMIINTEVTKRIASKHTETISEGLRPKIEMGNVSSSFHNKIISFNNDEIDNTCKSLTNIGDDIKKIGKPLSKSQSFKSAKEEGKVAVTIAKAASTDSVKFVEPLPDRKLSIEITRDRPEPEGESNLDSLSSDIMKDVKEITNEIVSEINKDLPVANKNIEIKNYVISTHKYIKDKTNEIIMREKQDAFSNIQADKKVEIFNELSDITISGPSHTAVVNISSTNAIDSLNSSNLIEKEINEKDLTKSILVKESQVSVTKIQLKHESTIVKDALPEFLNKQLNKVEIKPSTNVIFSMNSPRVVEEQSRPKTLNFDSDVNMEIIDKSSPEEEGAKPNLSPLRYKKNDRSPKKTPDAPKKPYSKNVSVSLDSLKNDDIASLDKSTSQDSLELLNDKENLTAESVIMRRKSVVSKSTDDEPELMKVFARRSLKIRDSDLDNLSQALANHNDGKSKDCDTKIEIDSEDTESSEAKHEEQQTCITQFSQIKDIILDQKEINVSKEHLTEPSVLESRENISKDAILESTAEVTLRKQPNIKNLLLPYPRSVSLSYKNTEFMKPVNFSERRVTTNMWHKNDTEFKEKTEEIITISNREENINIEINTEPKNVTQRKAEWEKRAQLAQKNTVP